MAGSAIKKTGSILFCDIRNFTSLFDDRDPIDAVEFANSVLAVLGETIEDHNGVVDRFTGDGFLAHFGFVKDTKHHAEHACSAAINLRKKLTEINSARYLKDESVITIGVGINTGLTAYCEIETKQLNQTTVMGDTVNVASRIEQMTKYFMVDILVSESTYHEVSEQFIFKSMPLKSIPGKKNPVQTYWLSPLNQ